MDLLFRRRMMVKKQYVTPLTFDILEEGDIGWVPKASGTTSPISYSKNEGLDWNTLSPGESIHVLVGEKVLFRGTEWPEGAYFSTSNGLKFNVSGNPCSLVSGFNYFYRRKLIAAGLQNLFSNCTGLVSAKYLDLDKASIAWGMYRRFFNGCTSLIEVPESLPPATAGQCYASMFQNCTSLIKAPVLDTVVLQEQCYSNMFDGCTALTEVKCFAIDISADFALDNWLSGVAASGTFTKIAGVTWPTGASGIPSGWTVVEV